MKVMIQIIRIITGVLFIASGLVKANDPLGLSYKMQEFFEVLNMSFMNDYSLAFSLVMNVFEVVAGIALLIGWRFKLISWLLLLLMLVFTFLTGFAALSGKIKTCGCFGDCIPLPAMASFIKDLLLLMFILLLLWKKNFVKPVLSGSKGLVVVLISVLLVSGLQYHVLRNLPVVDCLPYKEGNNLLQKMQVPPGAVADSFAISFRYKKDGKVVEFDAEHFPEDFDESYEFVDRSDKLVREGTGRPAITEFNLLTTTGNDTTQALLNSNGYYIMVFAKDMSSIDDWIGSFKQLMSYAANKQMAVYVVTADVTTATMYFAEDIILKSDATVIKTAARVNPTYFLMKGPVVVSKKGYRQVDELTNQLHKLR